jgi:hypothetical protein
MNQSFSPQQMNSDPKVKIFPKKKDFFFFLFFFFIFIFYFFVIKKIAAMEAEMRRLELEVSLFFFGGKNFFKFFVFDLLFDRPQHNNVKWKNKV